ncbi:hypothetical protein V6N12_074278 [Hibiscus sabdariffa]|uniref:Uncharacterized protein n=1 Tax=Hibiscus sabdariffa TaxID=183260 RepID=A0ABR2BIA8_9ROSI
MNRDALRPPGASHSSSITAQVGDAAFVVDNDAIHNSNVVQVSHGSHAYAGAGACAGEIYARFLLPEEAAAAESGVQAPWHTRSSPAQFGTCKVDVRRLVDLGLGSGYLTGQRRTWRRGIVLESQALLPLLSFYLQHLILNLKKRGFDFSPLASISIYTPSTSCLRYFNKNIKAEDDQENEAMYCGLEAVDEEESNQLRQQKVLLGKRKTACSSTDPLSEANESVSA